LQNKVGFHLHLGFYVTHSPETRYLTHLTHALQIKQIWLLSVNKEAHYLENSLHFRL